jgi:hypothetical protein
MNLATLLQLVRHRLAQQFIRNPAFLVTYLKPRIGKQEVETSYLIGLEDPIQIHVKINVSKVKVFEPLAGRLVPVDRDDLVSNLETDHRPSWPSPREIKGELSIRAS